MARQLAKKRTRGSSRKAFKVVIEKHRDGYVAYPLGFKGVVVGEGDTWEEALGDVKSAIRFHMETFGKDALEVDSPVMEVFVAEAEVTL
jgi:predicted RNase H-like HicB family nuclease